MKYLKRDQLRKVLTIAKRESLRDWLMILVGYNHGMRASEVCNLTGSDVSNGMLNIVRGKGSKLTVQMLRASKDPLFNEKDPLQDLAAACPGKLFEIGRCQFWRRVKRYCELADVYGNVRALKHSVAMHAVESKIPILQVQQHLGHKDIKSTLFYVAELEAASSTKAVFSVL